MTTTEETSTAVIATEEEASALSTTTIDRAATGPLEERRHYRGHALSLTGRDGMEALDELMRFGDEATPDLIALARGARDDKVACRAIRWLGSHDADGVLEELLLTLTTDQRPKRARAAARVLARDWLDQAAEDLVRLLSATSLQGPGVVAETPVDVAVRQVVADEIAKREQLEPLVPFLHALAHSLVASEDHRLRTRIAEGFGRLWTGAERVEAILAALLDTPSVSRDNLDRTALCAALRPDSSDDKKAMYMTLVEHGAERSDKRELSLVAGLLILVAGSAGMAGQAVNDLCHGGQFKERDIRDLRIQIGGEVALAPILRSIQADLEKYFRKPLHDLRRQTETNWQTTMRSAQRAFSIRIGMSVAVFVVGVLVVVVSAGDILFGGGKADEILGPGVTFVSGLASMLLVIYRGPLRDIRQSVSDLGSANAAFIAYVHRVSEISHTFSAKYLDEDVTYPDLITSCGLLGEAAEDAIAGLRPVDQKESAA